MRTILVGVLCNFFFLREAFSMGKKYDSSELRKARMGFSSFDGVLRRSETRTNCISSDCEVVGTTGAASKQNRKSANLPSNITACENPALKHGEASVGKKIGETHSEDV